MKQFFLLGIAIIAATLSAFAQFTLPELPYKYSALEPFIDSTTMYIHLNKHHAAYTNNLNAAIEKYPALKGKSIEQILGMLDKLPASIKTTVVNNAGGYYNHCLFWKIMAPAGTTSISPELEKKLIESFGSIDVFKSKFEEAAMGVFGSGWAWVIKDPTTGKLQIVATPNQYNTMMSIISVKGKPVLALDVWEHAYYLHYQSSRADYVKAFWNVVNWKEVEKLVNE